MKPNFVKFAVELGMQMAYKEANYPGCEDMEEDKKKMPMGPVGGVTQIQTTTPVKKQLGVGGPPPSKPAMRQAMGFGNK